MHVVAQIAGRMSKDANFVIIKFTIVVKKNVIGILGTYIIIL